MSRERELQTTPSHLQQSEMEFHDSKPKNDVSDDEFKELKVSSTDDLSWRRDCF